MPNDAVPYGRKTQKPSPVAEVHILWITGGLGRDGDTVSFTAASRKEALSRPLLKYARQASLVEQPTLPGPGVQIAIHRVLELVSGEGGPQGWQVIAGFEPAEAFGCLHHGGPGPAQCH